MIQNYFTDYPERVEQLTKYCVVKDLALPLEEAFGEKDFYKNSEEAFEFYMSALSEVGRICAKEIRPTADEIDRIGTKMIDGKVVLPEKLIENMKKITELGIFAGPIARKYGGFNTPRNVQYMMLEMFGQACPNTALTIAAYSMATFIEKWGTEAQRSLYLPKMLTNEWQASMALTEPGAGSDLGKLRSTGKKSGDHWVVNGTKQFITSGQGTFTFALVRTDPTSMGLAGLSVLIVPHELEGKENYKVAKIEDKVCLHASPTCELLFENSVGYLLGPEGDGFKVMADLMNEARLAMSALAVGIAVGALQEAKDYAQTRTTMGKPIIEHPMVADMLYEAEIETRAMRALVMEASASHDRLRIAEAKGDVKEIKRWKRRYRRLTPLCKYYCSEKTITIAKNAVQIFGGYGVCRDYPVERLLRETIIYPIYEGTSQIQSLMVLKDTLKDVAQQATGFLGSLAGAWAESLVTRDPVKKAVLQARNELNQGIRTILTSILKDKFKSDIEALRQDKIRDFLKEFSLKLLSEKTDLSFPFLWAERFTRITCDYYSLKSMADHYTPGDTEREKWILEFAALAIPRMRLENEYMVNRLPSTMDYIKQFVGNKA